MFLEQEMVLIIFTRSNFDLKLILSGSFLFHNCSSNKFSEDFAFMDFCV